MSEFVTIIKNTVTDALPGSLLWAKSHSGEPLLNNPITETEVSPWVNKVLGGLELGSLGLTLLFCVANSTPEKALGVLAIDYLAFKGPVSLYCRIRNGDIPLTLFKNLFGEQEA